MRITFTKGLRADHIAIARSDGTDAALYFPKKGSVPHDAFHFFVERELRLVRGFWGFVATGMDPAEVGRMAAEAGHASTKRARTPDQHIVELLQAERLVECFEAESWSGGADNEGIMAMAESGWASSFVCAPQGVRLVLDAIRTALSDFSKSWQALADGESLDLLWED